MGFGDQSEMKLVVHFREKDIKGVVLNLTRAEAIAALAGDDTDGWPGTRIQLVRAVTRFQGRKVDCIAIEAPSSARANRAAGRRERVRP